MMSISSPVLPHPAAEVDLIKEQMVWAFKIQ